MKKLMQQTRAQYVLVSLNQDGLLINAGPDNPWVIDRLPAFCLNPVDTAGAGDCLMITTALALSCGARIWESAFLGSIAAGIQVNRLGNNPISQDELLSALKLHQ